MTEYRPGEEIRIRLPGREPMEFCWCPATTSREWLAFSGGRDYFMMGSPCTELGRGGEELHPVRLTSGFWMGKYEVTWRQWMSVMQEKPSCCKECTRIAQCARDDLPVRCVSWNDCMEFVRRVNDSCAIGASLPAEAQWEYACRAGTETPFSFGTALNGDKANCAGNFPYGIYIPGPNSDWPMPVGSYEPNPWGLYDMHGNVMEWCSDWYVPEYEVVSLCEDPTGPVSGLCRVVRGGCYGLSADHCRSARRDGYQPEGFHCSIGFRICCSMESQG